MKDSAILKIVTAFRKMIGKDLDATAVNFGTARKFGENDAAFRKRIITQIVGQDHDYERMKSAAEFMSTMAGEPLPDDMNEEFIQGFMDELQRL